MRRHTASRSERRRIVLWDFRLQHACNLLTAKQIEGHDATLTLTMSVDAKTEIVVDAALAFGGMDQHGSQIALISAHSADQPASLPPFFFLNIQCLGQRG